MRKILLFLLVFGYANCAQADIFSLNNHGRYGNYSMNNIADDLLFAEKQLFNKTYRRNSTLERLERLELAVFGAIQAGSEINRIYNIRKAVTNVASGGNGLQYFTDKMTNLSGNSGFGGNLNIGGNGLYGFNSHNCRHHNWHNPHHHRPHYGHRVPPRHHHSHRLPPPCHHSNGNPIVNGDFMKNYSLGTSVKILDD